MIVISLHYYFSLYFSSLDVTLQPLKVKAIFVAATGGTVLEHYLDTPKFYVHVGHDACNHILSYELSFALYHYILGVY